MPKAKEPAEPTPAEPGTTEPATPPTGEPAATPEQFEAPEGYELIRTEDKNNLISARDKANNGNSELESFVSSIMQKDAVKDAVASDDFKQNYPDVSVDELLEANPTSDEEIVEIAKAKQARYEKAKQSALQKVQVADEPQISAADRDTKLEELKKPGKPRSAFQQALKLSRLRTK